MSVENLKVWLPFDTSPTADLCGNTWAAYGSPTIQDGALKLPDSSSYLAKTGGVTLGEQDFTISLWFNMSSSAGNWCRIFQLFNTSNAETDAIRVARRGASTTLNCGIFNTSVNVAITLNENHHLELDYTHSTGETKFFIDGVLKDTISKSVPQTTFNYCWLGRSNYSVDGYYVGTINEFQIYDGVALHTENFTPPTAQDYLELGFAVDGQAYFDYAAETERNIVAGLVQVDFDTARTVKKLSFDRKPYLKVWLPFHGSITEDLCGNEWTVHGSPTLSRTGAINGTGLYQPGNDDIGGKARMVMTGELELGGQPFTLAGTFNLERAPDAWNGGVCGLFSVTDLNKGHIGIVVTSSNDVFAYSGYDPDAAKSTANGHYLCGYKTNQTYSFELSYDGAFFYAFVDGECKCRIRKDIPRKPYSVYLDWVKGRYENHTLGTVDELRIYDGIALHTEDYTPPTAENFISQTLELEKQCPFLLEASTDRKIKNDRTPAARYIEFKGGNGSYGSIPLETLAGKTIFTIEVKFSTTDTANSNDNYAWKTIIGREISNNWQDDFGLCVNNGKLCFWAEPKSGGSSSAHNTTPNVTVNDGKIHTAAVVSSGGAIDLYCDGELVAHTDNVNAKITSAQTILLAYNSGSSSYLQMDFYEARLWSVARKQGEIFSKITSEEEGLEAWYVPEDRSDIIPDLSGHERHATLYNATSNYIYEFSFDYSADTDRTVNFNYTETAGDFTINEDGTFYQTEIKKCFTLPPSKEFWFDLEIYFDGENAWRLGNTGENGITGLVAQADKSLAVVNCDETIETLADTCKVTTTQDVLLHMIAGEEDGYIEVRVDGKVIYTYTGNVNKGEDFSSPFLQSDDKATYFNDLSISNASSAPYRRRNKFFAAIVRKVANGTQRITFNQQGAVGGGSSSGSGGGSIPLFGSASGSVGLFGDLRHLMHLFFPTTSDIWIDFDIYFDGKNIWRVGNVGTAGVCGVFPMSTGQLLYVNNDSALFAIAGTNKPRIPQAVLFHMRAPTLDSETGEVKTSGIIEVWVNGKKGYTYTGNVNGGKEFDDIFLQSDASTTFFSNITISNVELDPRSLAETIDFCVRHNSLIYSFPLVESETAIPNAFAVHYNGRDWYNVLCEPTDPQAGIVRIWHDSKEYALSK